jgi:hypothetical protein
MVSVQSGREKGAELVTPPQVALGRRLFLLDRQLILLATVAGLLGCCQSTSLEGPPTEHHNGGSFGGESTTEVPLGGSAAGAPTATSGGRNSGGTGGGAGGEEPAPTAGQGGLGGFAGESSVGRCAAETRAVPYEPGVQFASKNGLTVTLVRSVPEPLVGTQTWELLLTYHEQAVLGATVSVSPFMPDHGHGSAATPVVLEQGDGSYRATNIRFTMTGYWRTTVRVTTSAWTDSVLVPFCVDG